MYHQVINIGENDDMPVVIEYGIDEDCNVLWIESIKAESVDLTRYFKESWLKPIEHQLWKGHDAVIRELDWLHGESVAAERAAFQEAYA